ncbi:MAG: hypothetical protein PXY39_10245 [archaeon]|nr:hypothetical protein [archaeon]
MPEISADILGKLGELGTETEFDRAIPREKKEKALLAELQKRGIAINTEILRAVRETVKGLERVRGQVEETFGELSIIGKGETKYGGSTSNGRPDFVAFERASKKPILIEVKNTAKQEPSHEFQARFYNTMLSTVGVVVCHERNVGDKFSIKPSVESGYDAESLLIYPRLGKSFRIRKTVDLSTRTIRKVWTAKELGLCGKVPATDCSNDCPHHRFDIGLPEDDLEALPPLPLVYAKGLVERNANIDGRYMKEYLRKRTVEARIAMWEFRGTKIEGVARDKIAQILVDRLDLDRDEAINLVDPTKVLQEPNEWPDSDKIIREMADDFAKWKKLLGRKLSKEIGPRTSGQTTRIYTLPSESQQYIKKSWDTW